MFAIKVIFTLLVTFMGLFFVLSLIGLLWVPTYGAIISDQGWFVAYTLCLGWWASLIVADDIHDLL